jgi:hypothetical protein
LNAETFFSAQIRILQYERQRCGDESWYDAFINEMRHYKVFDEYWLKQTTAGRVQVPMRPLVPLKLDTGHGLRQFRLVAETFAQDNRFRVIYCIPADPVTIQQRVSTA